ncbi:histidine-containing phosphotransfer protein 2-like [Carex rostrata]
MSAPLKAQLNYLVNSMFAMDFLDEQFTELQMLEDDSRGLLVEVISEFCDQPWLSQLSVLSSEPVVDFQEVAARVHKFKGTCSYVGAKRVALWCNCFLKVYEENDIVWYIPALLGIRREFDELHMRLKTMLQLEQQIQALDAKAQSSLCAWFTKLMRFFFHIAAIPSWHPGN